MDNNTHVWSQISAADSKISACRSALASIRGVLNECSGTLDGWKENRQKNSRGFGSDEYQKERCL